MDRYRRLLGNTMWLSAAGGLSKILSLFAVRAATAGLTQQAYGETDLLFQTANLMLPLLSAGMAEAIFRFALDRPEKRRRVFAAGMKITCCLALLLLPLFFGVGHLLLPLLSRTQPLPRQGLLLFCFSLSACLQSNCAQYVRACGHTPLYAAQIVLNAAAGVSLQCAVLLMTRSPVGYILSVSAANLLTAAFLFCYARLWRELRGGCMAEPSADKPFEIGRRMLRYGLPLVPSAMAVWLIHLCDRLMLTSARGAAENALYAVASKIPALFLTAVGIFCQAWQYAVMTDGGQAHARFYSRVFPVYGALSLCGGSFLALCARPAVLLLGGARYAPAAAMVPPLLCGAVCAGAASFLLSVCLLRGNSRIALYSVLTGALCNAALNALLIPRLGGVGAAWASCGGYLVILLLRALYVRRALPFSFRPIGTVGGFCLLLLQAAAGERPRIALLCFGAQLALQTPPLLRAVRHLLAARAARTPARGFGQTK